jgi:hypothetical protein
MELFGGFFGLGEIAPTIQMKTSTATNGCGPSAGYLLYIPCRRALRESVCLKLAPRSRDGPFSLWLSCFLAQIMIVVDISHTKWKKPNMFHVLGHRTTYTLLTVVLENDFVVGIGRCIFLQCWRE